METEIHEQWLGKEKKMCNIFSLRFIHSMAPLSSTPAWKILWTEEPGRLQSMGSLRVRHYWVTYFHFSLSCIGEGNGNPLQCSCLENHRDGWAAVSGVAQSRTRLKRLSSSPLIAQFCRSWRWFLPWLLGLSTAQRILFPYNQSRCFICLHFTLPVPRWPWYLYD